MGRFLAATLLRPSLLGFGLAETPAAADLVAQARAFADAAAGIRSAALDALSAALREPLTQLAELFEFRYESRILNFDSNLGGVVEEAVRGVQRLVAPPAVPATLLPPVLRQALPAACLKVALRADRYGGLS